ncbi:hypothetical protein GCM10011519_06090 [Marmoricola endophyticus]|uniref:Lysine N-acyltransferase MbtK n=1 Tax=Marmoricola endophyticus TaxID=2040280 RepID=A0A917BE30_9ACTN|nr:GNAT family N-acetyltransferase [Marmoricola endophyticus]GGF35425.1 hypothetical protein GCM10011519_06090 [Marmoricola endophyticus]
MRFTFRAVDPAADAALLHDWVTRPYAAFWDMQDASVADVEKEYAGIAASGHHEAFLGLHDGEPAFLAERYDPAIGELAEAYDVRPGDVGMHVLVAPPSGERVHGWSRAVMDAVLELCFAQPGATRVVVEPDVRNGKVQVLNAAAGFVPAGVVRLPEKDALLSFCTREDWVEHRGAVADPASWVAHLTPERMQRADRALVAKAIGELAHERVLAPEDLGEGRFRLATDVPGVEWTFAARRLPLDHWSVDPASLERTAGGEPSAVQAQRLVLDLVDTLPMGPATLPVYLEEIAATLAGHAWKQRPEALDAVALSRAPFQDVESGMTEGHPCFIANNGRLGYGVRDHAAYAPETGSEVRLFWLAVRRDLSVFATDGPSYEDLMAGELSSGTRERFAGRLTGLALDPDDYRLLPCHPWQWEHKIAVTFAPQVARREIVCLGVGEDLHQAQQSVRTFFNLSRPDRHYVKTALSVLNMGFMRGLSPAYMRTTPAVCGWVADLVAGDEELRSVGFHVLREVAGTGYLHAEYEEVGAQRPGGTPYGKMLSALWRESPVDLVGPGERLATMASLLHVDASGRSVAAEHVRGSGLAAEEWVRRYLTAYLRPLLHCFYAHRLVFMPHGENLILVLRDHVPVRALMKDVGEEVAVFDADVELPELAERIRLTDVDPDLQTLSIFTDVVDCFLRFLAARLDESGLLQADAFWAQAADVVAAYQREHPELADRFAAHDLFAPTFALSCLNRLQLRDNTSMLDLADPAGSLAIVGELVNPLAAHRPA